MAVEEAALNISAGEIVKEVGKSIMNNLPPEISANLGFLIHILEAIGIAFFIYLIFLIIKAFFAMRTNSRIKKIAQNVEEINKKLDVFVNKGKRLRVPKNK